MPRPTYHLYGEPARPAAPNFLRAVSLEDFVALQGSDHRTHRHPLLYQLTYVTGGRGHHVIGDRKVPLSAGGCYLLRPGVDHACHSANLAGFVLHFSPDFLQQPPKTVFRVSHAPPPDRRFLAELCAQLLRVNDPADFRRAVIDLLLLRLSTYLTSLEGLAVSSHDRVAEGFLHLVSEQVRNGRKPAWYADQLSVTPSHLNRQVRIKTGRTCRDHLRERLLAHARHLLQHSSANVGEIAAELGFNDPNYFHRWFKKHTGRTPGRFRTGVQ